MVLALEAVKCFRTLKTYQYSLLALNMYKVMFSYYNLSTFFFVI